MDHACVNTNRKWSLNCIFIKRRCSLNDDVYFGFDIGTWPFEDSKPYFYLCISFLTFPPDPKRIITYNEAMDSPDQ